MSHLQDGEIPGEYNRYLRGKIVFLAITLLFLTLLLWASVSLGAVKLPLFQTIRALLGLSVAPRTARIIWSIRLPQALAGIIAGSGLAVAGAAMQSILRNPLGSPFTLGISNAAAFDAILLGRKPHMGWRVQARDLQVVDAAIKRLHLSELSMHYIDRMSSGELQKVCIARALVQEPKVLLLDEPTASLDLNNQLEIMRTIRMVVEQHAVGVVMTMHDLNLALRFADTFLLLKDGCIQATGQRGELTAEMIQKTYGVPVEIIKHGDVPVVVPL